MSIYKTITDGSYNEQANLLGLGIVLLTPNQTDKNDWITHSICVEDDCRDLAKSRALVAEFLAATIGIALIPTNERFRAYTDNQSVFAALDRNKKRGQFLQSYLIQERDKREFLGVHSMNDSNAKRTFSPKMKMAHDLSKQARSCEETETYTINSLFLRFGIRP